MFEVLIEETLKANPDKVWALVENFADLSWYPPAEKVEKIGEGVGQIRRIHMAGMDNPVDEILESLDAEKRQFSYTIPEMPMHDYRVVVNIAANAAESSHCDVRWHATFSGVSEGLSGDDMANMMKDAYTGMLGDIEKAANA